MRIVRHEIEFFFILLAFFFIIEFNFITLYLYSFTQFFHFSNFHSYFSKKKVYCLHIMNGLLEDKESSNVYIYIYIKKTV
jgi:hypothetical protein